MNKTKELKVCYHKKRKLFSFYDISLIMNGQINP